MAKLFITEYEKLVQWAPQEPCILDQVVAIGAGSVQSLQFTGRTRFVRLQSDIVCSVAFGPNPTATANTKRIAANQLGEIFSVNSGDRVAVITNT